MSVATGATGATATHPDTDSVAAAVTAVHEAFGLTRFDTGGPAFAPIGDHQGLLILVSTS